MSSNKDVHAMVAARMQKKKEADRLEAAAEKAKAAEKAAKKKADEADPDATAEEMADEEEYVAKLNEEEAEVDGGEEEAGGEEEEAAEVDVSMEDDGEERKESPAAAAASSSTPTKKSIASKKSTIDGLFDEEDDDEQWNTERNEAEEAAEAEAAITGGSKKKRRLTKLSEADEKAQQAAYRRRGEEDEDDGFIVDDLGDGYNDRDDDFGVKKDKKMLDAINMQKSFMPNATPQEQGGRKRFLAWNLVGAITATEVDSEHNAGLKVHHIELTYADSAKHKAAKFRDFYNFRVAALGAHGAVFASQSSWDKSEKKQLPSTVFFRPSDTWDNKSTSEWQLQMDLAAKEEAELVAIGDTWVAIATNKQYIRIVSHSGIQIFILSLNGPCVSIVGYQNTLAIVYHDGVPIPGHQNLGLIVMDIVKKREIYRGKCVITPRSKLTWIGYSDIGMLLCMDSFGTIRGLGRSWGWQWTPILDTNLIKKVGSTDQYWPVSLIDDKLMCVLLKNGARFPAVQPRPVPQSITMQLPFLDLANENRVATTEESHARYEMLWYNDENGGMNTESRFYTSKQETQQDKLILSLFQKACSLDRSSRALDLCTMLHRKKAVEIAANIAQIAGKKPLVNRINMLLQVKFPANSSRINDNDDGLSSFMDSSSSAAPASKRGTLRRPAVSFDDAEEENKLSTADDGEAEYDFSSSAAGAKKSSLKRKSYDDPSPSQSTPLSQLTSSMNVKSITSANVKPKAATAAASSQASTQPNPFANTKK